MKINKSISLKNRTRLLMMALSGSILLSSCGMANIDEPVEDKKIESTTEHTEQIINDAIDVIESDIRETEEELEEERNQVKEPVYFTYYIDLSSYTGDSLTEALKKCGYEYSFAFRKEIAKDLQMKRYAGTQVQNLAILAICGGTLTITDEDLISEVDALIEEILNNIGLGSEKEVKEKTKKVNNKEEVVQEIIYKVVPVEPEKIPTTNWQSTAPVTNNSSNGNNNNDNNPSSDNNPSDDNDKKPNPPKPPVKHKHKFKETITYEANKDNKTHKVISTKECSCGKKEVKVINEKEQCKEGQPKKEGNFNCYYCEHCHQLLRKVKFEEDHKHNYTQYVKSTYKDNGKHTSTYKCSCGETITKDEECSKTTKDEGNVRITYCSKCGHEFERKQLEEGHKHSYTQYVGSTYKDNGKHTSTYKCSCGETITKDEECSKTTKDEGNVRITYCSKCGHEFERKQLEEEKHTHNHVTISDDFTDRNHEFIDSGDGVVCRTIVKQCSCGDTITETINHSFGNAESQSGKYEKIEYCTNGCGSVKLTTRKDTEPEPDLPDPTPTPEEPEPDLPDPTPTPEEPEPDLPDPTPTPEEPEPDLPVPNSTQSQSIIEPEVMLETLNSIRHSLIRLKKDYLCNYSFSQSKDYMLIKRIK